MSQISFMTGLLLPWLTGALCLWALEARTVPAAPAQGLRRAGYGLFLGYALLYGVMVGFEAFAGRVTFGGVMAVLALLAVIAAGALWRLGPPPARHAATRAGWLDDAGLGRGARMLLAALLAWTAVHVAFAAIEIILRPVYPWDAWQTWIYRAKAWYLSGGMSPLVGPQAWLEATQGGVYTTNGFAYPDLPSAIPYWAALSLGRWSETLINLPVLLCGTGIGLALYGQLRAVGASVLLSSAVVFMLWSTPLFGVHAALGGYADIWMAGYAGLGFVALLASAIAKQRPQWALGLLMLALGLLVKDEGVAWFALGLVLVAFTVLRARVLLSALGVVVVAIAVAAVTGTTYLDIPWLGGVGLQDGRLFLPVIGSIGLELHDVRGAYARNLFAMGSWNLLWGLLAIALVAAAWPPVKPARRAGMAFLLLFAASQLLIFGFTDRGSFAGTYTAINRLPLQLLPALLFAGAMIFASRTPRPARIHSGAIAAAMLGSALLVAGGLVLATWRTLPGAASEPLSFSPMQLRFAMGSGSQGPDELTISGFANGFALVTTGPVEVDAGALSLLRYSTASGEGQPPAAFFWRPAGNPNDVVRLDLPAAEGRLDLSTAAGWGGRVIELGFLFPQPDGGTARLGSFSLEAPGLASSLGSMAEGWFRFEPWTQKSVNFLHGGERGPDWPLPVVLAIWLLLAAILMWLPARRLPGFWPMSLGVLALSAWMVLDVRWTVNSYRLAAGTVENFSGRSEHERLLAGLDGALYGYIDQIKQQHLGDEPVRILLVHSGEGSIDFLAKRARYHLLPHSVSILSKLGNRQAGTSIDFVLFLGNFADIGQDGTRVRLPIDPDWRERLRPVAANPLGVLFGVADAETGR